MLWTIVGAGSILALAVAGASIVETILPEQNHHVGDVSIEKARSVAFRTPPHVCWMGDSRTDLSTMVGPTITIWSMGSYVPWLRWSLAGRMKTSPADVLGVVSKASDHWLSVQVPQAIARKCQIAVSQIGVNDIFTGTTASVTLDRLKRGAAELERAGVMPIFIGVLPSDRWSREQLLQNYALNDGLAAMAGKPGTRMLFADPRPSMIDTRNAHVRSGYLIDGVHDTSLGGAALASAVRPIFDVLLPQRSATDEMAGAPALLANGALAGDGGRLMNGATGNVPDAWSCGLLMPSAEIRSVCAATGQGVDVQIIGNGEGKEVVGLVQMLSNPSTFASSKALSLHCHLSWTGGRGLSSVGGAITAYGPSVTYRAEDGNGSSPNNGQYIPGPFPDKGEADIETPPLAIPAGIRLFRTMIFAQPADGAEVKARVSVRSCRLTVEPDIRG